MPTYKFIITSVIGAQTEDEAKEIFLEVCSEYRFEPLEEFCSRAEIEEVSD